MNNFLAKIKPELHDGQSFVVTINGEKVRLPTEHLVFQKTGDWPVLDESDYVSITPYISPSRDLAFLKEMKELSQSLLEKQDGPKLQQLDGMIEHWIDELEDEGKDCN